MKHQYFGDVNDYRKYGLLRCIAEATGQPLGVLWLLTPDDGRSDGEFRRYLREPAAWRHHDPALYDSLSILLLPEQVRHVGHTAAWKLLPDACYFDHVFTDSATDRRRTMSAAEAHLGHCPFIFVDPDNGIEVKSIRHGSKGSSKYVYWEELTSLFGRGHSLLVYQHYPRIPRGEFHAQLAAEILERLSAARVAIFSTPYVAFFLASQSKHLTHLPAIVQLVHDRWNGQIQSIDYA